MSIRIDGTNTTANPGITGGDADTGLQFGTDEVSIVTGGTEKVKVDSSGNLGIGIATPGEKLHISGGANDRIVVSGSGSSGLLFENTSGTALFQIVYDDASSDDCFITTSDDLVFRNQSGTQGGAITERMRIDNTGQVIIKAPDSSTTSVFFALQHNNGVGKVQLDMGGNVRAVTTSGIQPIVSERRLKTNINSIDLDQAWTNAKDIPWRTFEYLDNLGTEYTGHIVDEVEAVDPSLILPTDQVDDQGPIRTYDNAKLNAMRFVALQEALKRIETLETRLTALEGGAS